VSWKTLAGVSFIKEYDEELDLYIKKPIFSADIQKLDGQEVIITGYVVPIDNKGQDFALSANPFTSCFFCGQAGPESVMDLKLKKNIGYLKTDKILTFKGYFKLNSTDIYELNYILEEATIHYGN
jgi:hypothetical protein